MSGFVVTLPILKAGLYLDYPQQADYSHPRVKQVWFWEDGAIAMHHLEGSEYQEVQQSRFLPNLDTKRLAQCAVIESRPQAVKTFRQG